jgi:O-antigen/teichoic acid export membrane protein
VRASLPYAGLPAVALKGGVLGRVRELNGSDARVAYNSALLFANTLSGAALGVLFWTITAGLFSVASVGFTSAVVSMATLVATFGNLGLGSVVVRYLPAMRTGRRAFSLVATLIPAVAAALIVTVGMAFPYWPLASDLVAAGAWGVILPSALAVGMSAMFVQDSIFIARHEAKQVLVRGTAAALVRIALLVPFGEAGTFGLVAIFLAGTLASVALGARAWTAQPPAAAANEGNTGLPSLREVASYGSTNYLAGLFGQTPQLLYPALVASQVSHSAAGAFSFAWMAGAMLLQLPPSAANVLMSQLVRKPLDVEARIRRVRWAMVPAMLGLALVTGLGVAAFAALCLPAVSGEIVAYLPLLLGGTVPFAWIRISSMEMSLHGDLRRLMLLNGTVALSSVALPVGLVPAYGVLGLESGWVASQALGVLLAVILSRKSRAHTKALNPA